MLRTHGSNEFRNNALVGLSGLANGLGFVIRQCAIDKCGDQGHRDDFLIRDAGCRRRVDFGKHLANDLTQRARDAIVRDAFTNVATDTLE